MNDVEKYIYDNIEKTVREQKADEGTLLALPYPYSVPCIGGMFQEMYYWDTYFTNLGFIRMGKTEQAKNNCDNMRFLINRYGFMPNGNRTYYLKQSQPPFYSLSVRDVFAATGDKEWLSDSFSAIKREYDFWTAYRMTECGLNRYYGALVSADSCGGSADYYISRTGYKVSADASVDDKRALGQSIKALCESGFDCTVRAGVFFQNFAHVDLNSLLYGMEKDLAYFADILENGEAEYWAEKAAARKNKMNALMWKEDKGFFADCETETNKTADVFSSASFYPLFVSLASKEQAERTVKNLKKLEFDFGAAGTEDASLTLKCQWDYPNGWACQHYVIVKSLLNYGYTADAKRISEKFVSAVERCFKETNNLWEKYDVVTGTVSASKEYETPPMLGWTAGVYLVLKKYLDTGEL